MDTPTAAIYARQSADRTGDSLAVTRQLELCRKLAAEQGWEVSAEYVDNDLSATSGVERPEFDRLVTSRPERVIVWHTDRLVRLTRDLERVIDLGVNVHAVKAGHLDLSNPAGRAVARTVTAWATYEGEVKADRQRAANDQRAAAGLPYIKRRSFGYAKDGVTIVESEAAELRRVADAVIRGRSLNSLARDLNDRGVATSTGRTWRAKVLRELLLTPRIAGLRSHRGEVVGKAVWDPILDEDTAATVRAMLTDRPKRGRPRTYLLSGLLVCSVCGSTARGAMINTGKPGKLPHYRCLGPDPTRSTTHVKYLIEGIEEYVTTRVIARLSLPDALDLFTRPGTDEGELARVRGQRDDARARLDGLAEAFAMGDIDRSQLQAGTRRLRERIATAEEALAAATTDPTLAEVAGAQDVAAAFDALPVEVRRQVIDTLATITLHPGNGRRTFDPEQALTIEWRAA